MKGRGYNGFFGKKRKKLKKSEIFWWTVTVKKVAVRLKTVCRTGKHMVIYQGKAIKE